MLYHYPDPFNILAIKAGSSDESRWKGKSCSTEKTNNNYYYCTVISKRVPSCCCSPSWSLCIARTQKSAKLNGVFISGLWICRDYVAYLVSQLLTERQRDGEQHQHLVQPRNRALRLGGFELHGALIVGELVRGKNQRWLLDVEAQGEVLGQVGRQTLHVAALHQLIDRLLLGHDQTRATALQGI